MKKINGFVSALVGVAILFAGLPSPLLLAQQTLKNHVCWSVVAPPYSTGSVSCNNDATGPSAPCTGTIEDYPQAYECDPFPEFPGTQQSCQEKWLYFTDYQGTAVDQSAADQAACYGVPTTCLACGAAAVFAGLHQIPAALCAVVACIGMSVYFPTTCCLKKCVKATSGIQKLWKIGC